jgi:hypothetical protein
MIALHVGSLPVHLMSRREIDQSRGEREWR